MTSLLLTALLLAALPFESPGQEPAGEKPHEHFVTTPVKSFIVGKDGEVKVLDDHGIAFVDVENGFQGPLQLLDVLGPRRYIGVQLITLTPELRRHFGVPADRGVMVSKVLDDTPAARAGIAVGDVLVAADGRAVAAAGDVTRVLSGKEPGQEVRIELFRDGEAKGLAVAFEERDATELAAAGAVGKTLVLRDRVKIPIETQGPGGTIAVRALSQEDLDDALRALDGYFQSGEWQQRVKQLQSLDLDQIQQRMKTLERRLQELERELAEKRR